MRELKSRFLDPNFSLLLPTTGWAGWWRRHPAPYKQFVFRPSGAMLAVYSAGLVKGTVPLPGGETAIYNSSGLNYIRHTDWLGSSRLATTWNHAVYSKISYAPFGETYNEAGTADRSFTGQDQDVVTGSGGTGVYDFLYRKHDPSAGRWLSPDPSGWSAVSLTNPQSLNRYAYVLNSPLALVDPLGLNHCDLWSGCGGTGDCTGNNLNCGSGDGSGSGGDGSGAGGGAAGGYGSDTGNGGSGDGGGLTGLEALMNLLGSAYGDLPGSDGFGGCSTATDQAWSDGDNTVGVTGYVPCVSFSLTDAPNNGRLICTGKAYVLAGNPANVGQEGFPGVTVTNGSAAVIPRQFTGQLTGGPVMRSIGASTFGNVTGLNGITQSFSGLTQSIGMASMGTAQQVQDLIMSRAPGQLVLEIVGGNDLGKGASVTINMPNVGQGCPAGTT